MIHNIVVVDGQEYKAVQPTRGECGGCSFLNGYCEHPEVNCMTIERNDSEQAIYKPHYKLKHK